MFALPAIVFFRAFGEEAVIYTGDLKREESILEWLMVQKDPSNDAIEELEGDELRKTIESSEAIAVFICKLNLFQSWSNFYGYFLFRFSRGV